MKHDPSIGLATSIHSAPGVYALLVGSGISRAAQVPTGWEVVKDLVVKAAAASGQNPEDPFDWYVSNHGTDPDYSSLLEQLASTPAERRNLLFAYFEPPRDNDDPQRGAPTAAHRMIARLV